ncbi:MAG: YfiR family protein [Elusimicrobia bacterium]|nr:YfiR family protein [Elusimicrobiota bacterium]
MSRGTPRRLALSLAVLAALLGRGAQAAEKISLEDKVRTAFLYNFTKYVRWPDSGAGGDFRISVIGRSGVGAALEELSRSKQVDGRRIRVAVLDSAQDLGPAHILFIACSERERLREILRKARGKPILTVGGCAKMAEQGAAVNFVILEGKMRFEINRSAVERAKLEMNSELLKLAILVEEENDAAP